jgi:hypothetical protein
MFALILQKAFVKMRELATVIIIKKSRISRDFLYQPVCAISI